MINRDDPEHAAIRRLVSKRFTRAGVREVEDVVRHHARAAVDAVVRRGVCDFAEDVAVPVPLRTIAWLLGFPDAHLDLLRRFSDLTNASAAGPKHMTPEVVAVFGDLREVVLEMVAARRREPTGDLVSALVHGDVLGRRLSDEDVFHEVGLLIDGGADTTRFVAAGGMRALLEHPDQLAALRRDPTLLPVAVDEMVRWVTPVLNMARVVTTPTSIHDRLLEPGEWVLLLYGAANRDDRAFPEPDRFDVTRRTPHLAFGAGTHLCLGAHLARLELRVLFEEVLPRLRDPEVAGPVEESPTAFVRGVTTLPVRFTPGPAA